MSHPTSGLHEHVAGLLEAMGDDPVTVAGTLRTEEIRGMRDSVIAHPVCRWLVRLVPDLGAVLGEETVNVFRPGRGQTRHGAVVPLPPAVRAFADRFDDGDYPDLELSLSAPVLARLPQSAARAAEPAPVPGTAQAAPAPAPAADLRLPAPDPLTDTLRLSAVQP